MLSENNTTDKIFENYITNKDFDGIYRLFSRDDVDLNKFPDSIRTPLQVMVELGERHVSEAL